MRFLIGLVSVLALLYGGYWAVGVTAKGRAIDAAIVELRAAGWQVETAEISTRGFPSRFDTTFDRPEVTAPSGLVSWQAPWAQLLAVSYLPNRAILALADNQTLTVAGDRIDVTTRDMRASVRVAAATSLPLEAVTVEAGPTALSGPGWDSRIGRLLAALRAAEAPASYDLFLELTGLDLPVEAGPLGASVPLLRLDATATLDAPLDRTSAAPRLAGLAIREARLDWGPSAATMTAGLDWASGLPEGPVTLAVTGWEALLDGLVAAGLVDPVAAGRIAPMVRLAGGGAADVTLEFEARDGALWYALIPVFSFDQRQ